MKSIKEIYRIGNGPSSSHTMGPIKAIDYMLFKYPQTKKITITLFGSLAFTGTGHFTDLVIKERLKNYEYKLLFDRKTTTKHPNTLRIDVFDHNQNMTTQFFESIGGGSILSLDGEQLELDKAEEAYPHRHLKEILSYCEEKKITLLEYINSYEKEDLKEYLNSIFNTMMDEVDRGLSKEGILPGGLNYERKSKQMYKRYLTNKEDIENLLPIGAVAAAEENASGNIIVTAPTCGSAGVLPGILYYLTKKNVSKEKLIDGLKIAGLFGQIAKTNASIAGSEAGCQAEIGIACSMGAALLAYVEGLENRKIAQSAEIALEHSLGLTCDPVKGLVQIPCIERNAMFALKAKDAVRIAKLVPSETTLINYDDSLATMLETGKDLRPGYKETAKKGLAALLKHRRR